jgi:hypothetical protein
MLECFVCHHRSEVGAPDPDVDNIANPLARVTLPCAAPDAVGEVGHFVEHHVHLAYDVITIYNDRCTFWRPESYVQDGSIFGDVNLLAPEHRVDPSVQAALPRQLKEQLKGLIGDPVFRVI